MAGRNTPESRPLAAERQRRVVQFRIRGLMFERIAQELGLTKQGAYKSYQRVLHQRPKADVEELRRLEGERIADLRQRVWTELAGRPDPKDSTKLLRGTASIPPSSASARESL